MAYKILITEHHSDLASELLRDFESMTFSLFTPEMTPLLNQYDELNALLDKCQPNVIINSLSFWDTNLDMTVLAEVCKARDVTLIHVSSFEVFAPAPDARAYLEQDLPNANEPRGQALVAAEQALATVPRHIILRLPLLLGAVPGNWLGSICHALLQAEPVTVSETHRLDPLNVAEAARVIIALIQQILCGAENWGILHLHTVDACYEAEIGDHIARIIKKEQFPVAPLNVVKNPSQWLARHGLLAGNLATNQFGIQMRSWRHGLKHQVMQWLARHHTGLAAKGQAGDRAISPGSARIST